MAGEFTKQEAIKTEEAIAALFKALSYKKRKAHLEHMSDIFLFLAAAKEIAPEEKK
jgi:hypothetical protein